MNKIQTTNIMKQKSILPLLFICFLLSSGLINAQTPNGFVGVGTTDPKAKLQVTSDTSGVLIPKYATLALVNSMCLPKLNATNHTGLQVFVDEAINRGLWYYNGSKFVKIGPKIELKATLLSNTTYTASSPIYAPTNLIFDSVRTAPTYGTYVPFEYRTNIPGLYMITVHTVTSEFFLANRTFSPFIRIQETSFPEYKYFYGTYVYNTIFPTNQGRGEVTATVFLNANARIRIFGAYTVNTTSGFELTTESDFTIVKLD